jgi:hypothetical protein
LTSRYLHGGSLPLYGGLPCGIIAYSFFFRASIKAACAGAYSASLRESGETLRITAWLMRAADGYVMWTETCEHPKSGRLAIQDDIAQEVTAALRESVR